MAINLRPPSQGIGNTEDKLRNLYSYLFQMTEELNVALNNVEASGRDTLYKAVSGGGSGSKTGKVPQTTTEAYQQLKSLIIKTATDVTSSMRKIVTEMSAEYVAQSEYGTYSEFLNNIITQSAEGYVMEWDAEQGISTSVADFSEYKANSEVYMKLGIVRYNDDGTVEAGVVIGRELQKVTIDGNEILISENMYSLLTADQLSFWQNGARLAYVSLTDFFVNKAYIGEVTTELIQSPEKGAMLALNEGLLQGIAERIDLSANESIVLKVEDEVGKATVELDNKISLVVQGTDSEGKVVLTEDALAAVADNIDFTANESIALMVEDEVGKATVELDDKISLVVQGTDSEGKVVLTEDALNAIADEIVLTTAKELESDGGTVIINDEGVAMTGGKISMATSDGGKVLIDPAGVNVTGGSVKLGSGSNTVFINDEVLALSGSNAESGASTVAIRGGGITMNGSDINMMTGGVSTVKIDKTGIDMNGSAISMQTTAGTEMVLDEQGVSMTGGRILLQSDNESLVQISKSAIVMSGSMFKMATSGTTDGSANAVRIDGDGIAMTGGRISLDTVGTGNLIKMATADGGSLTIDQEGVVMTGGTIKMATEGNGNVLIDNMGIKMTGGMIDMNADTELNVKSGKFNVSSSDFALSLVKGDGDEVVMDIGDDGYTTLKGVHAGNVREAVYGTLYYTNGSLGSLNGLTNLLRTTDARSVEYTMNKDEYGAVTFENYCGSVKINAGGHRMPTIYAAGTFSGQLIIENGLLTDDAANSKAAVSVDGGRVLLYNCWFAGGAARGLYAIKNGEIRWVNDPNASPVVLSPVAMNLTRYFIWLQNGGVIYYSGYIPGGEIWTDYAVSIAGTGLQVRAPSSGNGGGTVDTTKTATLTATLGWRSDNQSWKTGTMYQGYTTGKGKCYGCMRFTMPSDVTTVISATLTLHRVKDVGRGSTVEVNLYSSTSAWGSIPSTRTLRTSKATGPAWSQSGDIEATAAAQALVDGAVQLVLFQSGETSTLSGKVYSYNYAQFDSAVLNIAYR